MAESSDQADDRSSSPRRREWIKVQESLRRRLVLEDDFPWVLPPRGSSSSAFASKGEKLKHVAGVDISFSKEDPAVACGAVVVLDADTLGVVHEEFGIVRLQVPYVPGFLAFREVPVILELLEKIKLNAPTLYPQLLMVDGNGLLHPRGFGLACHLGVLADLPSIGISKNLHHVDGLTRYGVRQCLEAGENSDKDFILLIGNSKKTWGAAMRSSAGSSNPVYVSTGHRISLNSAITAVKAFCKYRIPEPIRQADIRSKVFLQKVEG